jgi:hypothetical protein
MWNLRTYCKFNLDCCGSMNRLSSVWFLKGQAPCLHPSFNRLSKRLFQCSFNGFLMVERDASSYLS